MITIQDNWSRTFYELFNNANNVMLISPFISEGNVEKLLEHKTDRQNIQVITRFNLNDFTSGASSFKAIKSLVEAKIAVRGVHQLHSKVYLFDTNSVIITSANFTSSGFHENHEFGIKSFDSQIIKDSITYFNRLWNISNHDLNIEQIKEWQQEIKRKKKPKETDELTDLGARLNKEFKSRRYFIKFLGTDHARETSSFTVRNELEQGNCHFAVCFSKEKGRPKRYNDGDVIFYARMLYGSEYAIFGKAIAIKHIPDRDEASNLDIEHCPWKEEWPLYVRVKDPIFIDSTMQECPKMSTLIDTFDTSSFASTERRKSNGDSDINPWNSLRQQADVTITPIAANWLDNELDKAIKATGKIPKSFIDNLYDGGNK
jgi:HKD family nuclease